VQDIHKMIKDNNSLESVSMTIHEQTNIISILDSCANKPEIEYITITCTEDLTEEVKRHVKMYKKKHIFKSVKVFIALPEEKQSTGRCLIF
jgi:transposase-like protein